MNVESDVKVALLAARAGAEAVRRGLHGNPGTALKGAVDPVTQIDLDAERCIRTAIDASLPDDRILGEEGGGADWQATRVWIVDPLDGTVNFIHGAPHACVSVALWDGGQPLVGVVIDVDRGDEYIAEAGGGASVNGEAMAVSDTTAIADALVGTGFPYDRQERADSYARVVGEVLKSAMAVRAMGSAALDLAWVARGRFDAYWEYGGTHGLKPWDVAAGILLVTEAGGRVSYDTDSRGQLSAGAFVASNGAVHGDLSAIVEKTWHEPVG